MKSLPSTLYRSYESNSFHYNTMQLSVICTATNNLALYVVRDAKITLYSFPILLLFSYFFSLENPKLYINSQLQPAVSNPSQTKAPLVGPNTIFFLSKKLD